MNLETLSVLAGSFSQVDSRPTKAAAAITCRGWESASSALRFLQSTIASSFHLVLTATRRPAEATDTKSILAFFFWSAPSAQTCWRGRGSHLPRLLAALLLTVGS